jgi:uncharacterized protein
MSPHIKIDKSAISAFCEKFRIRRLAFFGSVLTDAFSPESDVDILVEFQDAKSVSLFDIAGMEAELEVILGRKIDLKTAEDLDRRFRQQVQNEAEVQFAKV